MTYPTVPFRYSTTLERHSLKLFTMRWRISSSAWTWIWTRLVSWTHYDIHRINYPFDILGQQFLYAYIKLLNREELDWFLRLTENSPLEDNVRDYISDRCYIRICALYYYCALVLMKWSGMRFSCIYFMQKYYEQSYEFTAISESTLCHNYVQVFQWMLNNFESRDNGLTCTGFKQVKFNLVLRSELQTNCQMQIRAKT